jgi:tellurite methyltransferase
MWEKEYAKKGFYWGLKPSLILVEFLPKIPKGKALDIGAGEGRNSLFLAQHGFKVKAIDLVPQGLEKCKILAKKHNLPITIQVINVKKFIFKPDEYSLIISIATISFLKKSQVEQIISKIKKSLKKDGVIYIKEFTIADPMYKKFTEVEKEIEKNTFYSGKLKCYRYFFGKNELKKIFQDFKILYYKEYIQKDIKPHPHKHGIVELVAQKKKG